MDCLKFFEIARDVVTTVAAATAAVVAILGLDAWKKQMKGKTDYELARRYLRTAYKVRDAIKYIRNPFISIGEMQAARKEHGLESEVSGHDDQTIRLVYNRRWKNLNEAASDLDVELREAQVSWGKSAVEAQSDLDMCTRELYARLQMFLDGHSKSTEVHDIIYDGGKDSPFTKKIDAAVSKVEEYLKSYLR